MTPTELAATFAYNNYPDPRTQAYIDGITAMTPTGLAATYGYNNYPTSP
jgi:hypothetical protein